MGTVNGNVEMTLGSEDPVELQLLQDDGFTPIADIAGASALSLQMREPDGTVKEVTSALAVSDGPNAKIKLSHATSEFPNVIQYKYKVKFTLGGKVRWFPDGSKWLCWEVFDVTP